MLKSAQAQVDSSQKELHDARDYLQRLQDRKGSKILYHDNANTKHIESGDVKLLSSSSVETENETVSYSSSHDAPNSNSVGFSRTMSLDVVEGNEMLGDFTSKKKIDQADKSSRRDLDNVLGQFRSERYLNAISIQSLTSERYLNADLSCSAIKIIDCGITEINGKYHRFDTSDGLPAYSKIDHYEGREAIFTIGRWKLESGSKARKWYITATIPQGGKSPPKHIAFYVAYAPSFVMHPPKKNWMVVEGLVGEPETDFEGRGILPGPAIAHEMQVKSTTSPQNNRQNDSRNVSTLRSARFISGKHASL